MHITNIKKILIHNYSRKFRKYLHGTWSFVLMIFSIKEKSIILIFDPYNVFLAIATNIPQRLKVLWSRVTNKQDSTVYCEELAMVQMIVDFRRISSATKSDLRRLRRVVRTAERIYNPPHSPRTTHPEWAKELAKSLQTPHIQHTPSFTVWSTLQCSEHQNDQTQKQFFPQAIRLINTWH